MANPKVIFHSTIRNFNDGNSSSLRGIKVLDLSRLLPGGFCSMPLGDFGAEVIKVEEPGRGDYIRWMPPFLNDKSAYFLAINRNKKSLVLDLKKPTGKGVFLRLINTADVVLESFRPGVVDQLGIDYQSVAKVNPRIVYCSISAFGQTGPLRIREGHDLNCLALSGLLSIMGTKKDAPNIPGIPIADYSGGMMAVMSILLGLLEREKNGCGQHCDVSMLDAATSLMGLHFIKYLADGLLPGPQESMFNGAIASYNVYKTKDDRYVVLGAIEEKFWTTFCRLVKREDLIPLQWEGTAIQERVKEELSHLFLEKTLTEWSEMFEGHGICFSPVLTLEETLNSPHLRAREMFQGIESEAGNTVPQIGFPIKFSRTPAAYFNLPPRMGQDNWNILEKAGFSIEEIQILEEDGIISTAPLDGKK